MADAATDDQLGGWDGRWLDEPWRSRIAAMHARIKADATKLSLLICQTCGDHGVCPTCAGLDRSGEKAIAQWDDMVAQLTAEKARADDLQRLYSMAVGEAQRQEVSKVAAEAARDLAIAGQAVLHQVATELAAVLDRIPDFRCFPGGMAADEAMATLTALDPAARVMLEERDAANAVCRALAQQEDAPPSGTVDHDALSDAVDAAMAAWRKTQEGGDVV